MILEKKEEYKVNIQNLPPQLRDMAEKTQEFMEKRNVYHSAIREISTKLEILDDEFQVRYDYNPIHHIECRVKSVQSIFDKLERKGIEPSIEGLDSLTDIAGIRVVCNYIDDVYSIKTLLTKQDDVELIKEKDYIALPKESGYRSLHVVILIPVFLAAKTEKVPVEVQIRTIAMDTWASLEHDLKYKKEGTLSDEDSNQLRACAEALAEIDRRMQEIHRSI